MDERQPGVRRLCVAAAAGPASLLVQACRSDGFNRWHVETGSGDGIDLAFAPPGCDEAAAVQGLITVLRALVAGDLNHPRCTVTAFHVGITRVDEHGFSGAAVTRVRALVDDCALPAPGAVNARCLAVLISESLFQDLRDEGLAGAGWSHRSAVRAWTRLIEPATTDGSNDADGPLPGAAG